VARKTEKIEEHISRNATNDDNWKAQNFNAYTRDRQVDSFHFIQA